MTREKFQTLSWEQQERLMQKVDEKTDKSVLFHILRQACISLNHEDENYIPAIKEACRRLGADTGRWY